MKIHLKKFLPIHRAHHVIYGFGYAVPFFWLGYFKTVGFKFVNESECHDCTKTGVY